MAVYVDEVAPTILLNVTLSGDDCHWIVPVFPLNVKVVLLAPLQTVAAPLMLPATLAGFTVITTLEVVAEAQVPLVTTT